jgi:hypothetical protein
VPVDSCERSLGGVFTVAIAVASDCAVTPPTSLLAKNNAPMSSAAMAAVRAEIRVWSPLAD